MIKALSLISLISLALSLIASAEHGGTTPWLKRMNELAKKQKALVPNTSLPHRWSKESPHFLFKLDLDSEQKSFKLNLNSGKITEGRFEKDQLNSVAPEKLTLKTPPLKKVSKKSPDGKWQVSLKDSPHLRNLETGEDKALPTPPKNKQWEKRIHWHPDSTCFVLTHRSNHPTYQLHLIRSSPKNQVQPLSETRPYAKPGDKLNIPQPVICFTDGREPININPDLIKDPYSIKDLQWHQNQHLLTFTYIERGFGKYRLIEINADTRKQRIIAAEESDKFVHVFEHCDHHFLSSTDDLLWLSQRTGYNHLYLINRKNSQVIRPLTSGNWIVRKILSIDEKKRRALIQLSGYYPNQDPYYLHYALVDLDTAKLSLLTQSDGTHKIQFSPDKKHYLAEWSRIDHPPVYEVRRTSDQKLIATLNKPSLEIDWQLPQRFVTKDRNGEYDIHGVIWRPRNFEKGKKYPIIENIYAGPHGSFVPKKWSSWSGHKSEMAEGGFIVVQIDGLGTNHRGQKFQHVAYQNLKDSGFPDRIKWIKAAAAKYPEMDPTRVGIYGGSAGGQSSTAALLHHGDFYKAAVSDCGCHDNRIDKMWWNEQWLDWPLNDSYVQNSNRTHIAKLTGHLMLTVGEMDTNVDPASTYQIVHDLIKADKDFTFFMIPNAGHGAGDSPHFRRKRIEFFQQHLQ